MDRKCFVPLVGPGQAGWMQAMLAAVQGIGTGAWVHFLAITALLCASVALRSAFQLPSPGTL